MARWIGSKLGEVNSFGFKQSLMMRSVTILLATLLASIPLYSQQERKPNIILVLVDDLGWTDGSVLGSDFYQTPNIDRLAKGGARFIQSYSTCTVCSPSRASLMTGKYPARMQCTDWIMGHQKPYAKMRVPDWKPYVAEKEYTLAEALHDQGYTTAHIGKWHLGETENYWPLNQGFDINIGGWAAGSPGAHGSTGYFSPYNMPALQDGPAGEYLTERLANEAQQFIRDHKDKPFFLNYWLYSVHTPLQAKPEKIDKYKKLLKSGQRHQNVSYAAMVEHMDDALGKVMGTLKELGLLNSTIIVFTSDNGGLCNNKANRITDNFPLRSGKGDIYDGGVRVPLIFYWPGKIKPFTDNRSVVISADLYPTILKLSSVPIPKNIGLDGLDLSDVITQKKSLDRQTIYWHYPHYHPEGAKPYSAIRHGDWKLIEVFEEEGCQLYNLNDDIGEQTNLASSNPAKVKELLDLLNDWRQSVGAQMPTTNPAYNPARENEWTPSH